MSTVRWLGKAANVQEVYNLTFGGTWVAGETFSLTINSKTVTLTIGADVTTAGIAAAAAAMLKAKTPTEGVIGTETRNYGAQQIQEFQELDVKYGISSAGSVLTFKTTAGVPIVISSAEASTSGTLSTTGTLTPATAATGANFFNNAANWEGGSVPSAGDTLLFDNGSVDVKYALNNALEEFSLNRTNSYTGNIGLPTTNQLGYPEYRQRYLDLPNVVTTGSQLVTVGELGNTATAIGITRIDMGTVTGAGLSTIIYNGGTLEVVGGKNNVAYIYGGTMEIGVNLTANQSELLGLYVNGGYIHVGSNTVFDGSATAVEHTAGVLDIDTATGAPDFNCRGGTTNFNGSSAYGALVCFGGSNVIRRNGAVSPITVYPDGSFDTSQSSLLFTCAGVSLHKGSTLKDPNHLVTYSSGIDFVGCQPSDVNWDAKDHLTWTPSAI